MSKVWFITGASKGFGREWAEAALQRGDRVAATARAPEMLEALVAVYGHLVLPMKLDVTRRSDDFAAIESAAEHFGALDVVVNNAGYCHFGMVEELTENDIRAQLETNLFGALWVTQAALPIMRAQGSGHIVQVSSIAGVTASPGIGAYNVSKWALEALSESLAAEVGGFGIRVTLVEPGAFATDLRLSALRSAHDDAYTGVWAARDVPSLESRGDPYATRGAILKIVDAEQPPLRVFFGRTPLDVARRTYESRVRTWRDWQNVALEAHGR
jgi:NAD(P)-dependent dehydrogenase (short-subunit alcohol dehydrogenase family)